MSSMSVRWLADQRYLATDGWGNELTINGLRDGSGGAKPADLFPISVAVCTAYTLVDVLRKRRQRLDALEVTIEVDNEPDPPWKITRLAVHFIATGAIDPDKAEKSLELAHTKYCSVAASLDPAIDARYTIEVRPA